MLALRPGQRIGCLGIQLSNRRRVRVNGTIEAAERDSAGRLSLRLRVQQAYTNCPKYIQARARLLGEGWCCGSGHLRAGEANKQSERLAHFSGENPSCMAGYMADLLRHS